MRFIQVNKFSFILNKLFKINKNDLISNESMYDRFLEARLLENIFNICFLISSIYFMYSILDNNNNNNEIIMNYSQYSQSFPNCLQSESNCQNLTCCYMIKNKTTTTTLIQIYYLDNLNNSISRLELDLETENKILSSNGLIIRPILGTKSILLMISFSLFSLIYLVDELFKIIGYKLDYFCLFLNLIDLLFVILLISLLITHLIFIYTYNKYLYKERNMFKLEEVFSIQKKQSNLVILVVFIAWLRQSKYLNFTIGITQMNATLSVAFNDLSSYMFAFFILFTGFAVLLNRLFGAISADLNSIFKAQFSLIKFLIGVADFKILFEYDIDTSRFIFFSYFFLVFIIFLNIFLAIINCSYSYVLNTYENQPELDYYDFFKRKINLLINCFKAKNNSNNNNDDDGSNISTHDDAADECTDENIPTSLIEILNGISASKFRQYLLKNIQRIESSDIDAVYCLNNIREYAKPEFPEAFMEIFGDLTKDLDLSETILTAQQCKDIITKLNLAKKRISFLKNSLDLRKKSFFKPVFYQKDETIDENIINEDDKNSILSSINSKSDSNLSSNDLKDENETKIEEKENSKEDKINENNNELDVNHELQSKVDFDNNHTDLISWKEFNNLKKNLEFLQNEITIVSGHFLNEI